MSDSITLRKLLGLSATPAPLSESALILVDCQNTYREGMMQLVGVEAALEQCATLLSRARKLGTPIFHIQHDAGVDTPYDIKSHIGQIADKVRPLDGEPVIIKNYPNSFLNTDLHGRLKAVDAKNLVIVGFMTHMCISSTARAAFDLGYANNTVVAGATASRSLPLGEGADQPAEQIQASNLAAIADLFAVVVANEAALAD
jgi:nicotinamidase-related amidase